MSRRGPYGRRDEGQHGGPRRGHPGTQGQALDQITVGDRLQPLVHRMDSKSTSEYFYQLLHAIGVFGDDAPTTVRAFATIGQRSAEALVYADEAPCHMARE